MRLLALIAITFLLATASAMKDEEIAAKVEKMGQSAIGRTLLMTIQLQLESEGPVEDLIRMLQENEDKLQQEQKIDDDFIFKLQDQCDHDLANLVAEIQAHQKRIEELQKQLDEWIPLRDQKVITKKEKEQLRQMTQERLAQLLVEKEAKDQEWQEEQKQHDEAQYIIEKAKNIIVDALKVKSFLQTGQTQVLAQVSAHFAKHAKSHFKRQSWGSFFSLLAQVTASAPVQSDQSGVDKIIDLCDQLITKISESREIERKDYQHFMEAYTKTKAGLDAMVFKLTSEIDQLASEIDTLNKKIKNAQDEKKDQEYSRDTKQVRHDELLTWCNSENVNYSQRRQSRGEEMEVVSDAVALLQSNLRLFRQYVSQRLETVTKAT